MRVLFESPASDLWSWPPSRHRKRDNCGGCRPPDTNTASRMHSGHTWSGQVFDTCANRVFEKLRRRRKFSPKYEIFCRGQNDPQLNCSTPRAAQNSLSSLFCVNCICKTNICYPQFAHYMVWNTLFKWRLTCRHVWLAGVHNHFLGRAAVTPHPSIKELPSVVLATVLSCFFVGCWHNIPARSTGSHCAAGSTRLLCCCVRLRTTIQQNDGHVKSYHRLSYITYFIQSS